MSFDNDFNPASEFMLYQWHKVSLEAEGRLTSRPVCTEKWGALYTDHELRGFEVCLFPRHDKENPE